MWEPAEWMRLAETIEVERLAESFGYEKIAETRRKMEGLCPRDSKSSLGMAKTAASDTD